MKTIILAGGSGTRLWPLSRSHYPKQFLKLWNNESFLQLTLKRYLSFLSFSDIYILTSGLFYHDVLRQVKEIDTRLEENILLEPAQKNTAPAIAFAIKYLEEKGCSEKEILMISPADHLITPEDIFASTVKEAAIMAKESVIVTFGVRPHKPETGYGYIKALGTYVEKFIEKPNLQTAKEYLLDGTYYWNSGMFLFSLAEMKKQMKILQPQLGEALDLPYSTFIESFSQLDSISIDYAVMEKCREIRMVPLYLNWSDVGSWENVYDIHAKDENQNVIQGNVVTMDTKNSMILADKRMIATIGIENLLVIETDDVVMISHKEASQKVKDIVLKLKEKGKKEIHEHMTTLRPWGSYTVLEEGKRYKIKRIQVLPLQKLSLQLHYHRSEHWVVVRGTAKVTIGDEQTIVHEGESIFVPKSSLHRVENPGKVPLEIIEVQVGEYLGEDDIIRFEDVYGRLKEDEAFHLLLSKTPS